jgi:hypothetical protein
MTNKQINIAIAEACGWKVHPKDKWLVIPPNSPHSVQPLYTLPDYCNDLNAMHEAEKVLYTGIEQQRYWQAGYGRFQMILAEICPNPYSATARQRAEAFLRTLGKWEETK